MKNDRTIRRLTTAAAATFVTLATGAAALSFGTTPAFATGPGPAPPGTNRVVSLSGTVDASCGTGASGHPVYTTIAAAVTASSPGDVIYICAGTFTTQVTVPQDLTISGAGVGQTIVQAPAATLSSAPSTSVQAVIAVNQGVSATLESMTVDGAGHGNFASGDFVGIFYNGATGTVDQVTVQGVRNPYTSAGPQGVSPPVTLGNQLAASTTTGQGIVVQNPNPLTQSITVSNSEVTDFQSVGIAFENGDVGGCGAGFVTQCGDYPVNFTATGDQVIGSGPQTNIQQVGIQATGGAYGNVQGSTLHELEYVGTAMTGAGAIALDFDFVNASGAQTANEIYNANQGIVAYGIATDGSTPINVGYNQIDATNNALDLELGKFYTQGNQVDNGDAPEIPSGGPLNGLMPLELYVAGPAAVNSYRNTLSDGANGIYVDNGTTGTRPVGSPTGNSSVTAKNNDLSLNTTNGADNTSVSNTLDASASWWGDLSGPSGQGPGTGSAVTTNVTYTNWCVTQTCPSVPGAPTSASATAGNKAATVSWTAPPTNGGSTITKYVVTASPGGNTASVNAPTTTATVKNLTPGTAYTFTVQAKNTWGLGLVSAASNSVTVKGAPKFTSATSTSFISGTPGSFTVTTNLDAYPTPALSKTGTLPAGVNFVDNGDGTGTLSYDGTANVGSTTSVKFTATSTAGTATQTFKVNIDAAPTFKSASSSTFTHGMPKTFTITTSGLPRPAITETGTLPGGLTFTDKGNGSATIAGSAANVPGTYPLTLHATNFLGTVNQSFTLTVK